ncbi:hypothetical protein [Hymenobacter sp. BT730]|uniref:hypothetical protein n=1 Tax=Hymenobacter sp. BT730 TaxID=3063332 RepID=UPI0026DF8743|nr:hypothetical protein [Hymenobacter sp. BT730]
MRKLFLVLLAGLWCAGTAQAQNKRVGYELEVWPELQAEYALLNGGYLFLSAGGQRSTNSDMENRGGFYRKHLRAGYETFLTEQWSVGGTARYTHTAGMGDFTPEILLRHRSNIGALTFGQRLSAEYRFADTPDQTRGVTRLRLDLERQFPVGSTVVLRPRLAYELGAYLRLQRDEEAQPKERVIDFTTLRAEVGIRFSDRLDITPWFGYLASYQFVLPQTDSDGNPIPGGRRNFVTPTVGLETRITLFSGSLPANRNQLPTQH